MKQRLLIEFEMPNFEEMCEACDVKDPELLCSDMNEAINCEVLGQLDSEDVKDAIASHLIRYYGLYFGKRNRLTTREEILRKGSQIEFKEFTAGTNLLASKTSMFEKYYKGHPEFPLADPVEVWGQLREEKNV